MTAPLLADFMAQKGEAYSRIDTERIGRFWAIHQTRFSLPPIIHLVGTNGKGTTGRLLAHYLHAQGVSTGHYTSPHLLRFNERFWLEGEDVNDERLEAAHRRLLERIENDWAEALSYFEYATLLAAVLFEECQMVVMEAGLGGEFDATAIFEARLLLITPIDLDHQAFLGHSIEAIAATKLRAMRSAVILAHQQHQSVYDQAKSIAQHRNHPLLLAENLAPKRDALVGPKEPAFWGINRQLAFAATRFLGFEPTVEDFGHTPLKGRLEQIRPNLWIDVGHNTAAAAAIGSFFQGQSIHIIYNSFQDKNYEEIIALLSPIIKRLHFLPVPSPRAASCEQIEQACSKHGVEFGQFSGIKSKETYLVFGSFSVVEAFLKGVHAR